MAMGRRRIKALPGDVLVVNGYEVDVAVLQQVIDPDNRVLWAFIKNADGDLRPVPYDETRVVWLTDEDLVRSANDV